MTDARFPERWLSDRRVVRLSDAGFRLFVCSLTWSVSNRTGGRLYPDDLDDLLHVDTGSAGELVKAGLWTPVDDGWQVVEFTTTQTTKLQLEGLEHKRVMDRERQARKRAHDRGDHQHCQPGCTSVSRNSSRDSPRDVTRDTKARQGQDRLSRDEQVEADRNCPVCGLPIPPGSWYPVHPACHTAEAS